MFRHVSVGLRALLTFIGVMSCTMAKFGPELGITPEMSGMDSRAAAQEWVQVFPWKNMGFWPEDGMLLRYFAAVWLAVTMHQLWRGSAILGGALWTWFFIVAHVTVIEVSKLPSPMPNPNCSDKTSAYCQEIFVAHCFLGSLGLMTVALELIKGSVAETAKDKTISSTKKSR